jgi:hypothetical protein
MAPDREADPTDEQPDEAAHEQPEEEPDEQPEVESEVEPDEQAHEQPEVETVEQADEQPEVETVEQADEQPDEPAEVGPVEQAGTEPGMEPPASADEQAEVEPSVSAEEQAELDRLRAELAELRAHQRAGAGSDGPRRRRGVGSLRWAFSIALVVLASLLTIVAVVARYARSQVLDTDRYVATVSPLAEDPAVQNAIATQVTNEIFRRLDVEAVTKDALSRLTALGAPQIVEGLATPLADQVQSFTRSEVDKAVTSAEFARLWDQANRAAHKQVVAVLTGKSDGAVEVKEGAVTVDLGVVVDRVKQRLVDRGFSLAQNIPEVHSTFTLVESEQLTKAQRAVRLLDRSATALPFIVIGLAAAAVFVAPNRRRGLLIAALGVAISMVLLAASLALVRNWYLDNAAPRAMSASEAVGVAATLLSPLRTAMRAVLVLGLVVALAAFLAGPSGAAVWIRSLFGRARAFAQGRVEGKRSPSTVEAWIGAHKVALRIAIVAVGALVLAFWTYPSGALVLAIVVLVLAGLALIEVFGWSAPSSPAPTG